MSETAPALAPIVEKKKRARIFEYFIIVLIMGAVIAAAFYQESISAFFRLHLWDRAAPGKTVIQFLEAGKRGDKRAADAILAATSYQPVNRNGKWLGYLVASPAGKMEFLFEDLIGQSEPKILETEFVTLGNGAAKVTVSDAKGEPVKYRVEMTDQGWKVAEILKGRPVK